MLARVKSGEEITLTERGVVVARITPATPSPLSALISAERVRPASRTGAAPRPTIPAHDGVDSADVLRRMRDDERY